MGQYTFSQLISQNLTRIPLFQPKGFAAAESPAPPQQTEYMKVSHETSQWSFVMESNKQCKMTGPLSAPLEVISKRYRLLREDNEDRAAYHRHDAI